ncbi:MAG: tetratricopeptide repeat protein, partial [Polyangiales bacterium]
VTSRRTRVLGFVLALTLAVPGGVPVAFADEPTPEAVEAARTSFKEGLALEKAGDYAGAIAKFETTKKVKATPQVRFHIALCQERLGRWIDAADGYEAAAKQASFESSAPEVLKVAPELARKLRAKIPRLTIVISGGPAKTLTIDGRAIVLDDARRMQLDPGKHVVTANDENWNTARVEVTLGEGDDKSVTVTLAASPPAPIETNTTKGPEPEPYKAPPLLPQNESHGRTAAFAVGAVGVLALGAGFVFLGLRSKTVSDLDAECPGRKCSPSAQSDIDKAHTYTTLSRVGFGVGIVGIGAAIVILATGGKTEPPKTAGKLSPWSPAETVGLGLQGAF